MKPISIQDCRYSISPLIIGSHCVSKTHDDKGFDDLVELGGNCFYLHGEGGETQTRKNVVSAPTGPGESKLEKKPKTKPSCIIKGGKIV